MDTNIKALLNEIFERDGIVGLRQYASKDLQSQLLVEEFLKPLSDQFSFLSPTSQPTSDLEPIVINGWTAKCDDCPQFWYPAEIMDKCPDCGSKDHTLYPGTYTDLSPIKASIPFGITQDNSTISLSKPKHSFMAKIKEHFNKIHILP